MIASLTGTGPLLRVALKRERLRLLVWAVALAALTVSSYATYDWLFDTELARASLNATMGNTPAFVLLQGPAPDLSQAGGFTTWRSLAFGNLLMALMASFTVVRHSRAEEDSGRAELVAACVVGRHARLVTAVATAAIGSVVVGTVNAVALIASGAELDGAFALSATFACTGIAFAAIGAVAAQVGSFARTANSIGGAAIAVCYLMRGWGDSSDDVGWLSWVSPFGWGQQVHPFAENRWWALLLPIGFALVALAAAHALLARRDLGRGLLAPRRGPVAGGASTRNTLGLAWRLHRGSLLGWGIGFVITGAIVGNLMSSIGDVLSTNQQVAQLVLQDGSSDMASAFVSSMVSIMGIVAAAYGTQAVLRSRTEETAGRAEPLLATSASRQAWFGGHLFFSLAGSALLVALGGVSLGLGVRLTTPDLVEVSDATSAALVQIPAVWVLIGIASALFGLFPRLSSLAWAAVIASFVLSFFGPMLKLDQWILDISPFEHLPKLPGAEDLQLPSIAVLVAIALALLVASFAGLRRRNIG